jgi:hypothetical protein
LCCAVPPERGNEDSLFGIALLWESGIETVRHLVETRVEQICGASKIKSADIGIILDTEIHDWLHKHFSGSLRGD